MCVARSSRYSSTIPYAKPADDLGRAVRLAVPARVHVGREPEVGAEIDDVGDVVEEAGQEVLARAVRQHAEHEVEAAEVGASSGASTASPYAGASDGIQVGEPRARVRGRGDVHDLDLGVARQQPQRLDPRIA